MRGCGHADVATVTAENSGLGELQGSRLEKEK